MKKQTIKALTSGFLILSAGVLTATLATNLNSNTQKKDKTIKNKFNSVTTTDIQWPAEGQFGTATIDGVQKKTYTTTPKDFEILPSGNTAGLDGFRSGIANKFWEKNDLYINVVIPANVTRITPGAFTSNRVYMPHLHAVMHDKYISLGNKIMKVDFSKATKLETIELRAFNGLTNLKEIVFSNTQVSNISIGDGVFSETPKLESVTNFDKLNLQTIPQDLFKLSGLRTIKMPSTLKTIGMYAFEGTRLETLDFENTQLTEIGGSAFLNTPFKYLFLPDSVTKIGNQAFKTTNSVVKPNMINMPSTFYSKANLNRLGFTDPVGEKQNITIGLDVSKYDADFTSPNDFNALSLAEKSKYIIVANVNNPLPIQTYVRNLNVNSQKELTFTNAMCYNVTFSNNVTPPKPPVDPDTQPNPGPDNGGGETTPNPDNGGGETNPGPDNGGGETTPNPDNGGGETNPGPDNGGGETTPNPDNGGGETNPGPDNNGGGETNPGPDNGGGETTPNPDNPQPEENPIETKNNNSAIIGGTVGAILIVTLIAVAIILLFKRSKKTTR